MAEELLSLKWNNHQTHFVDILTFLREQEIFIDATLACGGKLYPAHKFVLSTCSDYFKQMFTKNPNKHPIVFMKDVSCRDLEALLDFMYNGEVNVPQSSLGSLIKTAEGLQIKGLAVPDDPPVPKRDLKVSGDNSYSPPPKRLRAREKSPHLPPSATIPPSSRSPHITSGLPDASVDEDSRTSGHSPFSDHSPSVNSKPNVNNSNSQSHLNNEDSTTSHSDHLGHPSNSDPSPGPSGLHRKSSQSKEEELEIKQEDVGPLVDLGDTEERDWGGGDGNGGMDDGVGGDSFTSDNAPNFSDVLVPPSDGSLNTTGDPAMSLLSSGLPPRRVARLLFGTDTICPLCRKSFSFPESMIRHCQGHLPSSHRLKCSTCSKSFHRKDQYKYHIARCDALQPVVPPQLPPMPYLPSP